MIQSVLLSKKYFKNLQSAEDWIERHGFKLIKVHSTQDYYRFRQFEPNDKKKYRTIDVSEGIKFIYEI